MAAGERRTWMLGLSRRTATAVLSSAMVFALTPPVHETRQSFNVVHAFAGGMDGEYSTAGLTVDAEGNLYGTTGGDGVRTFGTVFKLTRSNAGWTASTLYNFQGSHDGAVPYAGVVFGPDGSLYGTTTAGGLNGRTCFGGCGTVFQLRPPPAHCAGSGCAWSEAILYRFRGGDDGSVPKGRLVFDRSGDLYGTTYNGGSSLGCLPPYGCGTVYKLGLSRGGWAESILYTFSGTGDGANPSAGVILDSAGNLYGTTVYGGAHTWGTVFQLAQTGSGWSKRTLHSFQIGGDGVSPIGGLIFDRSGNLYGTALESGAGGGGTVFRLTPSNGGWTASTLFSFSGLQGPRASLTVDSAGNLYGTTTAAGTYQHGSVFKLTPGKSGWSYSSLHDFTGGSDGAHPYGNVLLEANGKLYGTATQRGSGCSPDGCGVVFEITP